MLSVLVVCTGNICRSPIAAGLLEDRSRGLLDAPLDVSSAGTWARNGNAAMPEAVAAAAELGADVRRHRARRTTADLARRADLILTMTGEHRAEVIALAPEAAHRTFALKELTALLREMPAAAAPATREVILERIEQAHRLRTGPGAPRIGDEDVTDPIGMGMAVYRAVAWDIEQHVDALVASLFDSGEPRERRRAAEG